MTFKIEKGVPVPPRRGPRECVYPFAEMASGDSFAVEVPEGKDVKWLRAKLTSRACAWAKRNAPGAEFTTRTEADGKSARIWLLTKPAPLNPAARAATPPPVAAGRVHKLEDDEDEPRTRKTFSHPIPAFTEGAAARVVKGKRY